MIKIADAFRGYLSSTLFCAFVDAAHTIAALAGKPKPTGRQRTRAMWRRRGRR